MSYFLWVPLSIVILFISAWFSTKAQQCQMGYWTFYLWLYGLIISIIPIWPLIARHSKNLVLDSLIYDAVACIAYTASIIVLTGWGSSAHIYNIIGVVLVVIGLILVGL